MEGEHGRARVPLMGGVPGGIMRVSRSIHPRDFVGPRPRGGPRTECPDAPSVPSSNGT